MHAEDPVIVGVINRKRDFLTARDSHWYRIPYKRMPQGVFAQYIAFFLSGKPFKTLSGSIPYYAKIQGVELRYRHELLPGEADHPRAQEQYYRLSLSELSTKAPPIHNEDKRIITFIYTTGDRFQAAQKISDLYSDADHFVERIFHKLRYRDITIERLWAAEKAVDDFAPGIRIKHSKTIDQTAEPTEYTIKVERKDGEDAILATIRAQIEQSKYPYIINITLD